MTITKKVVAIVLAFLMIFSSVSAVAYGWDVTTSDGSTLDITAQIYKNANGEWVEAEKVKAGETVKVRVSVGTDYYSNSSSLLFFYDNNFFEDSYGAALSSLTINPDYTVSGLTGTLSTSASPTSLVEDLVNAGCIDSDFADTHNYLAVSIESAAGTTNFIYDDSTWLFEVELEVLDTASGTGKFFVEDATVQSTTNQEGFISVPKGEAGDLDAWDMWLWDATFTGCSDEVSTESTLTLRANGGEFEDGSDVYTTTGTAGTEITGIPAVSNGTKTLIGWYDSSIENPTRDDCIECPTTYSLDADVDLTAFWVEKVTVTFDYNYDGAAVESEDVTPGYEFDKPENPAREGYTFKGWNTDKDAPTTGTNVLPDVYPETSTTYYAIWAKVVKTTFVDTLTNETVAEFTGDAGDPFEGTVTAPTHEGYRTIKNFRPAMPTVYPADDTTYSIYYEPYTYLVNYYVYTNGTSQPATLVAQLSNQYDAVINTSKVNYMYTVPNGYALDGWYTDAACSAEFTEGTTLTQVGGIDLYAVLEKESYDAVFYVDGNEYFTLNVEYGDYIDIANADGYTEPTKVGYTFTGWSPAVGYMDEEGKEFYATWTELPRTEEFRVDGELYQIYDTAYGESFDVPADPYKEGYTFLGWDADAEATTPDTLPTTMPENNTVYYAVFTANEYTATFDANTGVFADGAVTSKQVAFDSDILVDGITEPTKTGYTFLGWSLDSAATTGIKTGSIGKMDDVNGKTIYAVWSADEQQYTVNHYYMDIHGQYSADPEAQSFGANTGDKVTPELVNKDGFTYDADMSDKEGTIPETGTLTLKVYYTRNQYDLTFAHGYETEEADVVVEDVYHGADITALAPTYTRTGHEMVGWLDSDNQPATLSTMPIGDTTFTADWKVNQYTITYMVDGKQYGDVETYNYGDEIRIRDDATKTGYTFSGWTPATLPATMPDDNITVTGTFAINTYTINYMVDWADGNGFVAYDKADEFVYDTATSAKEAPVKTGYSFSGWKTTEACDADYVFANMPAKNVTVYGKFTVLPYTINYEVDWLDGNGYVAYKDATVNYGGDVSIEAAPVKTGYTFTGWTWTKVADGASESAPSTMPAYNLKATGTFTANPYTVTFDANKGEYADGATTSKEVAYDSAITSDGITEPTREGYTFIGWAKTADALAAEDLGIMDDIKGKTVYAVWAIETYTVTWTIEGASSTTTETYGEPLNPPAIPDKTGYAPGKWTPDVPATMPDDENLEFVAQYTPNPYTVTFDANKGAWGTETTLTETVNYDADINAPEKPSREGYTFVGWATTADAQSGNSADVIGKMDDVNGKTYYAVWTADEGGYIVNVYTMDTTGTYQLTTTTPGNGVSDQEIDVTADATAGLPAEGFYLDGQSKLTGTIPSDGTKLDLSIYYGRNTHTLTFDANSGYFNGDVDATAPIVETVYYGAAIAAPEVAKTGYSNTWAPALDATMPDADTTYTATWTANEYTVTFDANGGTGTSTLKVAYDADIEINVAGTEGDTDGDGIIDSTKVSEPSRTGYTFAGWSLDKTAESGIKTGVVGKMDVANDTDKVVYATWTINAYTVTFDANGGKFADDNTTATASINYGTAVKDSDYTAPTRYGYTLAGWARTADASATDAFWFDTTTTIIRNAATFYAVWSADPCNVTYYANGGSWADGVTEQTVSVDFDADIPQYENISAQAVIPARDGYTFAGWSLTAGEDNAVEALGKVDSKDGESVYAVWTANTNTEYTVLVYEMDTNGDYQLKGEADVRTGETDTLADVTDEANAGLAAEGFYLDSKSELSGNIEGDGSLKLYIYYGRNTHKLTFAANGGYFNGDENATDDIVNNTVYYGAAIEAPQVDRVGYSGGFTGVAATMPDADTTYTATWTANEYPVTYNANTGAWLDGETVKTEEVPFDLHINAYAQPSKDGYTFAGWATAADAESGNMEADLGKMDDINGKTFYATWTANTNTEYTVLVYEMDTNGDYQLKGEADVRTGETDTLADVTDEANAGLAAEGFYLDSKSELSGNIEGDGSLKLYIYYGRNTHKLTFAANGGYFNGDENATDDIVNNTVYYGAAIEAPQVDRVGYSGGFTGVAATMPDADTTYTATWTANPYTVIFDANQGVYADGATTSKEVDYDSAITSDGITAPTREGYTFKGWAKTADALAAEDLGIMDDVNGKTVYAVWEIETYTVTWVIGNTTSTTTETYGEALQVPPVPEKVGYTASDWAPEVPAAMPDASDAPLTFTVTYTANPYTVTFDANQGEYADGATTSKEVAYDSAITSDGITEPTREGYTFIGWAKTADALAAEDLGIMDDIKGKTVYAVWAIETYTVTWTIEGASSTTTETYGEPLNPPAIPDKTGYAPGKWTPDVPATMPDDENLEFVAQYTPNPYTVTFDANKGAWGTETTLTETVNYDADINAPEKPSREGYTFVGWATTADAQSGNSADVIGKMDDVNGKTYYAVWTADEGGYIVNVYTMDTTGTYQLTTTTPGNGVSDQEIDVTADATAGLPAEGFYLDGQSKLTGTIPSDGTKLDLSIYYGRNTHTLTFDANSGYFNGDVDATAPIVETVYYGAAISAPEVAKTGYSGGFTGVEATMPDADTTYTATWTANEYTVTFDANGGVAGDVSTKKVAFDKAITSINISNPTRTGYKFEGWSLTAGDNNTVDTDLGIMDNVNGKTVYAVWTANEYTVTYNANTGAWLDGENVKTEEVPFDAHINAYAQPAKTGYTFAGWATAADAESGSMEADLGKMDDINGKTFYATWTANPYTATFDANTGVFADGATTSKQVDFDADITVDGITEPTKTGYTFLGWSLDSAATTGVKTGSVGKMDDVNGKTVYAVWAVNSYTATFYSNGAYFTEESVEYGQEISVPGNPLNTGYDFKGWDDDEAATEALDSLGNMDDVNGKKFYAVWTPHVYTVTWNVTGGPDGTITKTTDVAYQAEITPPAIDVPEGYTLGDWRPAVADSMPAQEDLTYTARLTINTYTFTVVDDETETSESITYGGAVTEPTELGKLGHDFIGWKWYNADTNEEIVKVTAMPAYNVKVVAQYKVNKYIANFYVGDALHAYISDIEFGTAIDFTKVGDPTKTGYEFIGWGLEKESTPVDEATEIMDKENKTYYAQWEANLYTVTFDANNGVYAEGAVTSKQVAYDSAINAEGVTLPTREGYTHIGWATTATATAAEDLGIMDNINGKTVYAVWSSEAYGVIFDANGGEYAEGAISSKNVAFDAPITADGISTPTREGYMFKGWSLTAGEGNTVDADLGTMNSTSGKTVYAVWEIETYTVTWVIGDTTSTTTETYGKALQVPPVPEKVGYTASDWAPEVPAAMPDASDAPLIFTVTYTANSYTVTFDANAGEYADGATTSKEVAFDAGINADGITEPTRYGYEFKGWSLTAGENNSVDADLGIMDDVNGKTVYAVWSARSFTATFDANTGVFADDATTSKEVVFNTAITVEGITEPTKEGYTFNGWALDSAAESGVKTGEVGTMNSEDGVTVYATWAINSYKVTFTSEGKEHATETVVYGEEIEAPALPEKEGYTFMGWSTDADAETGSTEAVLGTMGAAPVEYFATWKINNYTVTFVIPGKDVAYHTTTADYGKEVTYPEVPGEADLPAGKSFNAWNPAAIASMPAENVTVTAVLDDIVYNVNLWVVNDAGETVKSETLTGILNEKITIPAVSSVIRKGYTATGWYTANDIVVPEGEYTVQGDADLYMHYTANGVEVTFYMDKEMTDSIGTTTATYEQALQLTVNEPSKTGYKFAGWYMDGVGEIAFDENGNGPVVTTTDPISVYALWTANEYTVTYVNGTETTEEKVAYDANIVAPAEPTKTGYTFAGWATDSTATSGSKEAVLGKMDDVNGKTFYATWTPISVDVIFNAHGGKWSDDSTTKTEGFAYDSDITAPAEIPVKEGHTLLGWSTDPLATEKEDLGTVDFTAAKTFYAVWTINSYTASFDSNGGTWEDGTTVKTDSYVFGDTVLKYNDVHGEVPVRTGYTFKGWAETADAEAALGVLGKMPASDKTFYAVWDANSYTVTWVVDGKTTEEPYDFGATINVPENPIKEGHRFVKWTPAVPATMPAENITIVALFETNVYDVIYVVDGKEVSRLSNEYGTEIATDISNVYTAPAGYVLSGWYSDAGYTTEFAYGATVPAEPTTLYAYTTAISYSVIFDANNGAFADGSITYIDTVEYLGEITAPADPTREGYTFTGWSPAVGAVLDVPANKTYTATWTALTYDITYYDGEEVYQIYEDVEYGTELFVPADPYRDGVTFVGWTQVKGGTEAENLTGATMPNKDVVYYAIFTTDVHTITYVIDGTTSETEEYPFGAAVTVPAPEKVGYTFSGWTWTYVDGEGATQTTTEPATMPAYDLTATGTFAKNTYTVTYMVDYADGNGYVQYGEVDSYLFEAAVDAVREDISKTGYTFSGWTWEKAEDSSAITAPSLMPAYDIIVRGTLTVNTYDISYKVDYADGKGFVDYGTADSYAYGADVTVKDVPVQDGYAFSGWTFTNADTGEEIAAPTTMPAYDVNVTGSFSRSSFTITYMVDYADGAGFVQYGEVETKNYGDALTAPTQPTKDGYAFSGWYTEETLTNAFEFTTMGDSDITLYAKFTITNNAVNFVTPVRITAEENYGKLDYANGTTESKNADYGTVVSTIAPATDPEIEYYTFKGWSTAPDGEVIDLAATTVPEGGATYYAVFDRVAVLLIPNADKNSTAVIDRADGGDGSGIGTFDAENFSEKTAWVVYGLKLGLRRATDYSSYLAVQGDGKFEVIANEGGLFSTGARIVVTDKVTGEVVEEFWVVVFGDINGDGRITNLDTSACVNEVDRITKWSITRTRVYYKYVAADVNNDLGNSDGRITTLDTTVIRNAADRVVTIDQTTGGWA